MRVRLFAVLPILLYVVASPAFADSAADAKRAADITATKAAIAAKEWDKASALLNALRAAYPDDQANQSLLKAALCQGQGKSTEALGELCAALDTKARADAAWVTAILDSIKSANPAAGTTMLQKLGDCYRRVEGFASAARCYEAALAKPDTTVDDAKAIRRWLIKCHIRAREWDKVVKEVDAVAAESPECAAWSYYSVANYYKRAGNYPKSIEAYNKSIASSKDHPAPELRDLQTELAQCYISGGQWDDAAALVTKLAAQYPDDAAYWHRCTGAIYKGQGKYPEAIAELKQALGPETVTARKLLGECYRDSMTPAQAAPLIKELDDKYPTDGPYLPTIAGRMYQDMKQYDEAVAIFKSVITRFPNARWQVWDACYYIGECCYAQGKGDEALAYIKDFYAKHSDRPIDFAIAYGKTLLYPAKRPREAAEVLAKCVELYPGSELARELRPMLVAAYVDSGQMNRATTVLESMVESATDLEKPGVLLMLGDHYVTVSKYREAASMFRGVLAICGCSKDVYARAQYQLGICYRGSTMNRTARRCMENVIDHYPDSQWASKARGMLHLWAANGG